MPCASQARAYVLCAKRLQRCCPRRLPARDPGAMQHQTNTFLIFHIALFSPHTPHFILALHLNSCHLSSFQRATRPVPAVGQCWLPGTARQRYHSWTRNPALTSLRWRPSFSCCHTFWPHLQGTCSLYFRTSSTTAEP